MPVRLVTGSRAALERAFADEVARLKAPDPLAPVHVLVGGTLIRPYLRRVLADRLGGVLDVHLLTAGELGLALGQHTLLAAGRRPMPFLADRVLAARAAVEVPGAYAPVSDLPGFPGTLARTLRDLRFAGVSPDALQRAADAEPEADDPDAVRLASLAAIHRHVSEARAGRFGVEDALASADPSRLGEHGLLVFGVWETTAVLRHALRAIAVAGAPLTVFTPRTGGAPDDALQSLWSFADDLGARREDVAAPGAGGGDCARTQAALFGWAPEQRIPDGSVALVSAPDPEREVREVVRACVGWADEGIGFHEMAIAYRDGATYRPLLDAALRDAGIAAYVHEGTPILERPVGRRVAALLALADARDDDGALRLERSSVVELLADARLPDATFERYGRPSVPRWEAISRNASVVHGRAQWVERLAAYEHELAARYARENGGAPPWVADRREAIAHLASFVGDLAGALEARPGRGPWSAHVGWLLGLLQRYVDDAGAIAGAVADLAQLDAITGDVDAAGFLGAVTALLEGLRDRDVLGARQGAFGLRGVTVVDVNSLRHLGFRAVAIVGVAERAFPPPPREDPLLLDARRQQLEAQHGLELTLRARGGDPEPLQFHTAVQAAGERVLISFARTATDGRGQLPSVFFRAAAETLAGERVTVERVDAGDVPGLRRLASGRLTPIAADTSLTATERRRALLESRAAGAVELVRHRLPRTVAGARAIRSRAERSTTPFDGVLSEAGHAALGDVPRFGRVLSPTSLETYARCPHRHLLAHVLGLRELEEPEAITRISALDKGDAVHRILEAFLRERPAGPLDPRAERERLHGVAAPILRELEHQGRTGYPLLWDVDRIQILEDLERWLELDLASIADGSPRYAERGFEVRFGTHGRPEPDVRDALTRDEPLELTLPSGDVLRVGGYVDRVDHDGIGSRRFEVIDYKTGRMYGMKDEALRGGSQLQLGLYLLAIAQALGVPAERGVARYVSVDRKAGFNAVSYPGTLLQDDGAPLYALLGELVAARGAGDFHREPGDCTYCPVKGACEPRRKLMHERKSTAPALVAHKARQETYP